jgi:hypothetical protein
MPLCPIDWILITLFAVGFLPKAMDFILCTAFCFTAFAFHTLAHMLGICPGQKLPRERMWHCHRIFVWFGD